VAQTRVTFVKFLPDVARIYLKTKVANFFMDHGVL